MGLLRLPVVVTVTSGTVGEFVRACFARAVSTAIDSAFRFEAVPDDPALAGRADRRQRLNRAFERIERVLPALERYFEGFVVRVSAGTARAHVVSPLR
jgi:hypothetical protein